jgi:hypothetical protein
MNCFRFTTFRFTGRCSACGTVAELHDVDFKFFCAGCCPVCARQ